MISYQQVVELLDKVVEAARELESQCLSLENPSHELSDALTDMGEILWSYDLIDTALSGVREGRTIDDEAAMRELEKLVKRMNAHTNPISMQMEDSYLHAKRLEHAAQLSKLAADLLRRTGRVSSEVL